MKTIQNFLFISITITFFLSACSDRKPTEERVVQDETLEESKYRPSFHFSPQKNWMNDPNGMFYLDGVFHLYFQHHPESNVWGPMHWGHAISKDLLNWEEQSIALFPDDLGTIFSGSAVVDFENTSGLGSKENPPIIAIYTNHDAAAEKKGSLLFQTQSIAYSLDQGYTWTKYENNPVVQNPGIRDFRDPKVFWMESERKWIMTLAAGQETQFYASPNLREWSYLSSFGTGIGNHDGVWECPDLFPLTTKEGEETKWVHLVSINPGGPNGGSATQYFIGDFDGTQFTLDPDFKNDLEENHQFWTDFGKDNYAGVTFSNWRDNEQNPLFLGWMSNWQYANKVPTQKWRNSMTLPRTLMLYKTKSSYRLQSKLAVNLKDFASKKKQIKERSVENGQLITSADDINLSSAHIKVKLKNIEPTIYTFLLKNETGDSLLFGYNHIKNVFFTDRSKSGQVSFSTDFAGKQSLAPRFQNKTELDLELVLDKTSMELFFDSGETVLTEIFFPTKPFKTLSLITELPSNSLFSAEFIELDPLLNQRFPKRDK